MRYLLDTNAIVDLTSGRYPELISRLRLFSMKQLAVFAVTIGELQFGESKTQRPSRSLAYLDRMLGQLTVIPVGEIEARTYGRIRANLERRGKAIGNNDMFIAACAQCHDFTLVTRDTDEFGRIEDLRIEDWTLEVRSE